MGELFQSGLFVSRKLKEDLLDLFIAHPAGMK
jgi:hypothetical protein